MFVFPDEHFKNVNVLSKSSPPPPFFFFLHYAITVRSRKYGKVYFGLLVIAKKYRNYFLSVKEKTAKITL